MGLLFLNSLKGLKKKKIQMLGIILMVMLSTGIYVTMNTALDRMEDSYYEYLDNQHVEYLSVDSYIDFTKDVSLNDLNYLLKNELSNLTNEEAQIIDTYKCSLNNNCPLDPFKDVSFSYVVDKVFKDHGADNYIKSNKIRSLQAKYDFDFELDRSKSLSIDGTYVKVLPYDENKNINKAYLVEGQLPINSKEITILPKYAETHNIKIGDAYKIGDIEYKVVGFAYAPDYIYPLVSYSSVIFDEEKNNIIYINNEDFDEVNGILEQTYSIYYNGDVERKFEINSKNEQFDAEAFKILNDESKAVSMSIFTVTRLGRIASLQLEFATNRLFAEYFLYLLLGISVFVIAVVTKKRIEDERLQIGVLKSLGYSSFGIAISYLVYPIIGSIIGGSIGYVIGIFLNGNLTSMYISYFLVPLTEFKFNLNYLSYVILFPTILLSVLSYFISSLMLRKKPLKLLKEGSNLKVNIFSKLVNKITVLLPFKSRFKYNLAFRSIPKLLIVSLTSFFTGMLIVLTLIGSNLMKDLVDKSFEGMDYKYMVYTNAVETEKLDNNSDHVLNATLPLIKVFRLDETEEEIEKETISVTGIDIDSKFMTIKDESDKTLNDLLSDEKGIIINANLHELYKIEIGDTLQFALNEELTQKIEYKVIGISKGYMDYSGYVKRKGFSNAIGYNENAYTSVLSNDDKYADLSNLDDDLVSKIATVLNFQDMKENISDSIEKYNATIYIVISFASIIAFVIITVIANIVVEENKKTISLMKVLGYKNKKISSIVLNIYTPIIIVSYFLSIPVMIMVLKKIVKVLAGSMEMTIPISLDLKLAMVGLICLLVAYYIAIYLSKKVLNKIPLAITIKRE